MILNSLFFINLSYLFIYLIYQFILYIYLYLFIYSLFCTVRRPHPPSVSSFYWLPIAGPIVHGFFLFSLSLLVALNFNSAFCCCSRGVLPGEDLYPLSESRVVVFAFVGQLHWRNLLVIQVSLTVWKFLSPTMNETWMKLKHKPWSGNTYAAWCHTGCGYQPEMTDIYSNK